VAIIRHFRPTSELGGNRVQALYITVLPDEQGATRCKDAGITAAMSLSAVFATQSQSNKAKECTLNGYTLFILGDSMYFTSFLFCCKHQWDA